MGYFPVHGARSMRAAFPDWSVVVLSVGFGRETLRALVKSSLEELGFVANAYDTPGYPVDPTVHSHEACLRAIHAHDIVIVLADQGGGGPFQIAACTPAELRWLREQGIIPSSGSDASIPTVFQVEVLTARALGKPTLVFIPKTIEAAIQELIRLVRAGDIRITRRATAPGPSSKRRLRELIDRSDWYTLDAEYRVPSAHIASFLQVAFLERLRKDHPNYVSFFELGDNKGLLEAIQSRIENVVEVLVQEHHNVVSKLASRQRSPLVEWSLDDLLDRNLIIAPPFTVLSGGIGESSPLVSFDRSSADRGLIASSLLGRRSVLLLGLPGVGKTTASTLVFRDLTSSPGVAIEGHAPLFSTWRELGVLIEDAIGDGRTFDSVIRFLLAMPRGRKAWPTALRLPDRHWICILDALDESSVASSTLMEVLATLSAAKVTLLVTCRRYDYDRHLQRMVKFFDGVLELAPWGPEQTGAFADALRRSGRLRSAEYIDLRMSQGAVPQILSFPLWLSIVSFLVEALGAGPDYALLPQDAGDYELLRLCSDAIAKRELSRHGEPESMGGQVCSLWSRVAWKIHVHRRLRRPITPERLGQECGFDEATPLGRVVTSSLSLGVYGVTGFFHEVFQEFWVAEHLVDRILDTNARAGELTTYFGYQRSVVTNKLIRARIRQREDVSHVAARLRDAFGTIGGDRERDQFAKNQIIYILGRIESSTSTLAFLRTIWRDSEQSKFVKYSAAFAAVILGDASVESEYYNELDRDPEHDTINRGYHLYYYGDIDLCETEMPPRDDGSSSAALTLKRLVDRLNRTEARHKNLRRIELLTLRRFLETQRVLPVANGALKNALVRAVDESKEHALSSEYVEGVKQEAGRLRVLLGL